MRTLLLVLAGAAVAAAEAGKMGLWSPLYYQISPSRDDEYAKFIQAVSAKACLGYSFQGAILTGPTNGPPPLKNAEAPGQQAKWEEYQRHFDYLYDAGEWQPFGYIYTHYGNRPIAEALADIERWCDAENGFRKSIRGIFVDSMAEELPPCDAAEVKAGKLCARDYYQAVMDHIKAKCNTPESGDVMIMLNPGRHFAECDFMTKNGVGFVNAFEDTFDTYENFNAKKFIQCPCKDAKSAAGVPVRCVASIHSVPDDISVQGIKEVMGNMSNNGFGAIFLTENKYPQQYTKVPNIWPQMAAAACGVEAYDPDAPKVAPETSGSTGPSPTNGTTNGTAGGGETQHGNNNGTNGAGNGGDSTDATGGNNGNNGNGGAGNNSTDGTGNNGNGGIGGNGNNGKGGTGGNGAKGSRRLLRWRMLLA